MNQHPALRLHVPEPTGRPGCKTDFSYLSVSPAGAVRRPSIDSAAADLEELGESPTGGSPHGAGSGGDPGCGTTDDGAKGGPGDDQDPGHR